jgi:exonuclease VII large subunit
MPCGDVDRRQQLLILAVSVSIIGTASLYLISSSMEEHHEVLDVSVVLRNPERYLNEEIDVQGNISGVKHYGNNTVFYLREGNYSLRCVYFDNMTIDEGNAVVSGELRYDDKWGNYELIVESVKH